MLAAWAESIACSVRSSWSESCSIISWSGSAREMPKLVFRVVLSAGGGAYRLRGVAIGVWAPKGSSAGVAGLEVHGGEPIGTVTGLEVGGGEPRGTVLKPKLFKGH
jgi:hypothetical protein